MSLFISWSLFPKKKTCFYCCRSTMTYRVMLCISISRKVGSMTPLFPTMCGKKSLFSTCSDMLSVAMVISTVWERESILLFVWLLKCRTVSWEDMEMEKTKGKRQYLENLITKTNNSILRNFLRSIISICTTYWLQNEGETQRHYQLSVQTDRIAIAYVSSANIGLYSFSFINSFLLFLCLSLQK